MAGIVATALLAASLSGSYDCAIDDPIQIAGTHPSLAPAPEQLALVAIAPGPCMFTEQACVTLVELSARDDGNAAFSILPAGSTRDPASGLRSLFHVVSLGTCRRRNGAPRR